MTMSKDENLYFVLLFDALIHLFVQGRVTDVAPVLTLTLTIGCLFSF